MDQAALRAMHQEKYLSLSKSAKGQMSRDQADKWMAEFTEFVGKMIFQGVIPNEYTIHDLKNGQPGSAVRIAGHRK